MKRLMSRPEFLCPEDRLEEKEIIKVITAETYDLGDHPWAELWTILGRLVWVEDVPEGELGHEAARRLGISYGAYRVILHRYRRWLTPRLREKLT